MERHQIAVSNGPLDVATGVGAVAVGQVVGEALVQPVGRLVVGVSCGRVEDDVGQLVRHHEGDPRVGDLGRRDVREQGPDLGDRQPADVFLERRADDVVEGVAPRVDEEVDRLRLVDTQQGRGVLHRLIPDRERPPPELLVALVPVDPKHVALERPPVESIVLVPDMGRGSVDERAVREVIRNPSSTMVFGIRLPGGVAFV